MESWKPCDFKTVLTFYIWLSEVWEKYDLLSVLFGSIVSNYSRIHWQKLISWKFDENFCIFCKIESIYVQINSLQIIKSTQTAVLSRFRFTVFCYTKLVKFCHHVLTSTGPYRSCAALLDISNPSSLVFWVLVRFGWFCFGLVSFGFFDHFQFGLAERFLCFIISGLIWLVWFCEILFAQFCSDFHKQKRKKKKKK